MAVTQKPLAGDELAPYEREDALEEDRCPDCGNPPVSTPNHLWCIRCAQDVASTHPTGKPPDMRLALENRFWEKVDIQPHTPDQCWEWTAGREGNGYGFFRLSSDPDRRIHAHRVAYAFSTGQRPGAVDAEDIRHICHNKRCCNPAHLLPGDRVENLQDSVEDGRIGRFTFDEVIRIRHRYDTTDVTQYELAEAYGVSQATISELLSGVKYGHVPMPPYE